MVSNPSYAAAIWFSGNGLTIAFEPLPGNEKGHSVVIPIERCGIEHNEWGAILPNQRGWQLILDLLKERARNCAKTVGTRAAPVQYDIDQMIRDMGIVIKKIGPKKAADETLTLNDLEL